MQRFRWSFDSDAIDNFQIHPSMKTGMGGNRFLPTAFSSVEL
jgi:hypothetical protein